MPNGISKAMQLAAIGLLCAIGLGTTFVMCVMLLQGKLPVAVVTSLLGIVLGYIGHALGVQTGAVAALSQSPNTTTVSSTQPVAVVPASQAVQSASAVANQPNVAPNGVGAIPVPTIVWNMPTEASSNTPANNPVS